MSRGDDKPRPMALVSGLPREGGEGETSLWRQFLKKLLPRFAHHEQELLRYQRATIDRQCAENQNLIEDAAKKAAERERTEQETVRAYFENVDQAINEKNPVARGLKLAKLLDTNPEVRQQLEGVMDLIARLEETKGTRVALTSEPSQSSARPRADEEADA